MADIALGNTYTQAQVMDIIGAIKDNPELLDFIDEDKLALILDDTDEDELTINNINNDNGVQGNEGIVIRRAATTNTNVTLERNNNQRTVANEDNEEYFDDYPELEISVDVEDILEAADDVIANCIDIDENKLEGVDTKQLEETLGKLTEQKGKLEAQQTALRNAIEKLNEDIIAAENDLEAIQTKIDTATRNRNAEIERKQGYEAQYNNQLRLIKNTSDEANNISVAIEESLQDLDDEMQMKVRIETYKALSEYDSTQGPWDEFLDDRLKDIAPGFVADHLESLVSFSGQISDTIQSLFGTLDGYGAKIDESLDKISGYDFQISKYTAQKERKNNEITGLNNDGIKLSNRLDRVSALLDETNEDIGAINGQIEANKKAEEAAAKAAEEAAKAKVEDKYLGDIFRNYLLKNEKYLNGTVDSKINLNELKEFFSGNHIAKLNDGTDKATDGIVEEAEFENWWNNNTNEDTNCTAITNYFFGENGIYKELGIEKGDMEAAKDIMRKSMVDFTQELTGNDKVTVDDTTLEDKTAFSNTLDTTEVHNIAITRSVETVLSNDNDITEETRQEETDYVVRELLADSTSVEQLAGVLTESNDYTKSLAGRGMRDILAVQVDIGNNKTDSLRNQVFQRLYGELGETKKFNEYDVALQEDIKGLADGKPKIDKNELLETLNEYKTSEDIVEFVNAFCAYNNTTNIDVILDELCGDEKDPFDRTTARILDKIYKAFSEVILNKDKDDN